MSITLLHGSHQNEAAQLQYDYQEAGLQDAQGGEKHHRNEQSSQKRAQEIGSVEDTSGLANAHPLVHLAGQGKLHADQETGQDIQD